ncbi:YqgE/AlgH family protein [Sphingomicrobium sp. GRR-S6-50]|uniref:UPF0301 protein NDO55_03530 n=2 Tax=Sphingomicrobium sediminis TaxID=2950949 RepID=A0A9X2J330_9SPHN|nr:YqgE/AlgH family protein [Sphingomicrobium sediminis]MCM8556886.1 YqgE/AlgH family protein [Sphingomicrobium sediminis]
MTDEPPFLTGRLLLALPGMEDERFREAAIVMATHDEEGAIGIGIGKTHPEISVRDLVAQFGLETDDTPDAPVHIGGPVEPGRGFVLHSDDWGGQDTIRIADLCSLTGTTDVLRAIGEGRGPKQFIVALGYAGWSGGQLEDEMTRHGWFVADGERDILFKEKPANRWAAAYRSAGVDPALLSPDSGAA